MELDWTTVVFEIVNFGVLMALLTRFLFKPVRKLLHERRAEIESAHTEAEEARAGSEAAKEEFERRRRELDDEADELRKAAKLEGEAAARQVIDDARDDMKRARAAFDAELERARIDAILRLRPELVQLAVEAGRRMLKELHAGDVSLAFARQGARKLREELSGHSGRPHVKAQVSPDADMYAVSLALKENLGDAEVEVTVDTGLVGGVRLLSEGIEVEASAGASLQRWLEEQAEGAPESTAASASARPRAQPREAASP
jgi:F-type H+-transporting ATPase subunit b